MDSCSSEDKPQEDINTEFRDLVENIKQTSDMKICNIQRNFPTTNATTIICKASYDRGRNSNYLGDSNVKLELPNVENLTPADALVLKQQLEEYLKILTEKVGKYVTPQAKHENPLGISDITRGNVDIRKRRLENTLAWFNSAFKLDDDSEDDSHNSSRQQQLDCTNIITMRSWFLQNCRTKNFDSISGYYVGKRSIYVDVFTTQWLKEQNYYMCFVDGNRFLRYNCRYPVIDDIKSDNLNDYLQPLTKEKILKMFETKDYERLELEIIKFIHCNIDDDVYHEDGDVNGHHFDELNY